MLAEEQMSTDLLPVTLEQTFGKVIGAGKFQQSLPPGLIKSASLPFERSTAEFFRGQFDEVPEGMRPPKPGTSASLGSLPQSLISKGIS